MDYIIYAVEDDESIRELYRYSFEPLGYQVFTFETAEEMLENLEVNPCHLIIMDVMLPGMDGISAVKRIREKDKFKAIPIIVISAKGEEINKVKGLDAGADDYLSKPFGVLELVARVKANLRKSNSVKEVSPILAYEEVVLNDEEHIVTVNSQIVALTLKEYKLLKLLLQKVDIVVTRESILNEVWGYEYYGETRTLDMHIKSLRSKISEYTQIQYIQTIRGVGYKLTRG